MGITVGDDDDEEDDDYWDDDGDDGGDSSSTSKLDVKASPITGSLPTQLGRLTRMAKLLIGDSSVCGDIPDEVSDLSLGSFFSYSGSCIGTACSDCTVGDDDKNVISAAHPLAPSIMVSLIVALV